MFFLKYCAEHQELTKRCALDRIIAQQKAQHEKAKKILEDNRAKLDELAKFLYERETITGEEFMEILTGGDGQ